MRKASETLKNLLGSRDNLVYVLTYEENAFVEQLCQTVREMSTATGMKQPKIKIYSSSTGMMEVTSMTSPCDFNPEAIDDNIPNVIKALQYVQKYQNLVPEDSDSIFDKINNNGNSDSSSAMNRKGGSSFDESVIFVFKDLHQFFQSKEVVRLLRDLKEEYVDKVYCPIFVTSPVLDLPCELEKIFTLYEMPLMEKDELSFIVDHTAGIIAGETPEQTVKRKRDLVTAFSGLTSREVTRAVCHCKVKYSDKAIRPEEIHREKVAIVKKSGALDFVVPKHKLSDLGGCEAFKKWIMKVKERFTPEAKEFGIPEPKGAMLVGVPGTSKTVSAEILASYLNVPLLSLDMAKIMGSFVGQSERQISNALRIVKSVSPCVLLLDECEKVLGGVQSSSQSDAGTLSRVMSQFLTFLQEDNTGVITIMTSNDVSQLPPELTRSGRIDAQWMFDLPNSEERNEIESIYIAKNNLDITPELKDYLTEKTQNFTGAEIKTVIENMTIDIFFRQKQEEVESFNRIVLRSDIDSAVKSVTPVFISSREKIEAFRSFAKDRYLNASEPEHKEQHKKTKPVWPNNAFKVVRLNTKK